ncbi:MAG: AtpZ/AtpI family protein [Bacillota bacterium]
MKDARSLRYLGLVFQLGLGFVASAFGSVLIGIYLDRKAGTSPVFVTVMLLLGLSGGLWNAFRTLKAFEEDVRRSRH